ncbi:hypothetical protein PVK06_020700 [Gossypium arboreum]|uniref:Retrotransposon Copia-like N-terminal domain-containing protein n=1 Tax=Gossypium arboreum TaxID=29729 RepID=A0ABR0PN24_GOSAR|nr:hypothetical protein PVK06_020700 [Gossypium arboreum]
MSTSTNKFILDLSKLEPLNGTDYRRWSQMMVIFFEQLEVYYIFLNPPATEKPRDYATIPKNLDVVATKVKFEKNNKMDTLEKKYGVDNAKGQEICCWRVDQVPNDQ